MSKENKVMNLEKTNHRFLYIFLYTSFIDWVDVWTLFDFFSLLVLEQNYKLKRNENNVAVKIQREIPLYKQQYNNNSHIR